MAVSKRCLLLEYFIRIPLDYFHLILGLILFASLYKTWFITRLCCKWVSQKCELLRHLWANPYNREDEVFVLPLHRKIREEFLLLLYDFQMLIQLILIIALVTRIKALCKRFVLVQKPPLYLLGYTLCINTAHIRRSLRSTSLKTSQERRMTKKAQNDQGSTCSHMYFIKNSNLTY